MTPRVRFRRPRNNEPDTTFYTSHWEPDKIDATVAATGALLSANGFKPLLQFP